MKLFFLLLTFSLISFSSASAPASEFVLDRIYAGDGSPGKFMDLSGLKIKRNNRTSFLIGGDVNLLKAFDDKISAKVSLIGVDQGGDKYLLSRERENLCSFILEDCLPCKGTVEAAKFDPMPDKCPMEKGTYKVPMKPIARLRNDWPIFLQTLIPPLVPFENWKINIKFLEDGELLDELIIAFRLLNEFSAA